jgi:hypothetical protein
VELKQGETVRLFFKDQMGGPGPFNYLDVVGAQAFEVGQHALIVRKESEDCYYPLMQLAAFKVMEAQ